MKDKAELAYQAVKDGDNARAISLVRADRKTFLEPTGVVGGHSILLFTLFQMPEIFDIYMEKPESLSDKTALKYSALLVTVAYLQMWPRFDRLVAFFKQMEWYKRNLSVTYELHIPKKYCPAEQYKFLKGQTVMHVLAKHSQAERIYGLLGSVKGVYHSPTPSPTPLDVAASKEPGMHPATIKALMRFRPMDACKFPSTGTSKPPIIVIAEQSESLAIKMLKILFKDCFGDSDSDSDSDGDGAGVGATKKIIAILYPMAELSKWGFVDRFIVHGLNHNYRTGDIESKSTFFAVLQLAAQHKKWTSIPNILKIISPNWSIDGRIPAALVKKIAVNLYKILVIFVQEQKNDLIRLLKNWIPDSNRRWDDDPLRAYYLIANGEDAGPTLMDVALGCGASLDTFQALLTLWPVRAQINKEEGRLPCLHQVIRSQQVDIAIALARNGAKNSITAEGDNGLTLAADRFNRTGFLQYLDNIPVADLKTACSKAPDEAFLATVRKLLSYREKEKLCGDNPAERIFIKSIEERLKSFNVDVTANKTNQIQFELHTSEILEQIKDLRSFLPENVERRYDLTTLFREGSEMTNTERECALSFSIRPNIMSFNRPG